jgi:hypothetical protein
MVAASPERATAGSGVVVEGRWRALRPVAEVDMHHIDTDYAE